MDESSQASMVVFPRVERAGFMWGMDVPQFVTVCLGAVVFVIGAVVWGFPVVILVLLCVSVPLWCLALVRFRQRPLVDYLLVRSRWLGRSVAGHREWTVKPEAPVQVGQIQWPGAVGARMSVFASAWGDGAILWDAKSQCATAVVRCEMAGWALASESDKADRARAYGVFARSIQHHPALSRIQIIARSLVDEVGAADRYRSRTQEERGVTGSAWAEGVHAATMRGEFVTAKGEPLASVGAVSGALRSDALVAITLDASKAQRVIAQHGGGIRGMSYALGEEVRRIQDGLGSLGVMLGHWLTPTEVADVLREATDLEAMSMIAAQHASGERDAREFSGATPVLVEEREDIVWTGGGYHQVFWIQEWPRTKVAAGFLYKVITAPFPHCVCQVWHTVSAAKALRQIDDARMSSTSRDRVKEFFGRPRRVADDLSDQDVHDRELELAEGYADVRLVGYIVVSGASEAECRSNSEKLRGLVGHLDIMLLERQQWAAFCAAALPLGWGLGR
ncbi:SCO6880 family protein [Devriesea agamarum]|uniref:SCO6880 family protein n=1 Tax=Devriesea agamarum TaxID=472569 RepID=UPI00071DC995|nr:SCO6880 family protein [Devriesea agamarum]